MTQERSNSLSPSLLFFLAGAAAGAVLVALTTPKRGADLRGDISDLGRRAKRRVDSFAQGVKGACSRREQTDPSQAGAAWDDLKEGASRAGSELKQSMHDAAETLSR